MADIKQAAKWMQESKVVHRSSWGGSPVQEFDLNFFKIVLDF